MSEGLAECEWISGVLESAVYQDYEPLLHRRKSTSLPVESTVTVMKADSHLQIDPSTVCVIDAKSAFDHLVRESTGGHCRRTAQELCVIRRSMQTEGEAQMGTTRADGRRRLDEEAWEQRYDVTSTSEESANWGIQPTKCRGCSHTIKVDEASGSDP